MLTIPNKRYWIHQQLFILLKCIAFVSFCLRLQQKKTLTHNKVRWHSYNPIKTIVWLVFRFLRTILQFHGNDWIWKNALPFYVKQFSLRFLIDIKIIISTSRKWFELWAIVVENNFVFKLRLIISIAVSLVNVCGFKLYFESPFVTGRIRIENKRILICARHFRSNWKYYVIVNRRKKQNTFNISKNRAS